MMMTTGRRVSNNKVNSGPINNPAATKVAVAVVVEAAARGHKAAASNSSDHRRVKAADIKVVRAAKVVVLSRATGHRKGRTSIRAVRSRAKVKARTKAEAKTEVRSKVNSTAASKAIRKANVQTNRPGVRMSTSETVAEPPALSHPATSASRIRRARIPINQRRAKARAGPRTHRLRQVLRVHRVLRHKHPRRRHHPGPMIQVRLPRKADP